jgi:hypothetical protein
MHDLLLTACSDKSGRPEQAENVTDAREYVFDTRLVDIRAQGCDFPLNAP